jgi:hypothetical protein
MAREAADSATDVTNAERNKPPHQDQNPSLLAARNRPKHHDKKSLVLMTCNASCLLSSGRELSLLHLLTSSAVDVATVTECKMTETAKEFVVADYTTFLPKVPKVKSKTRVIILVKNDLITRANVHLCQDLMDSQTQSVWLPFGPVSSMGDYTLCGVYVVDRLGKKCAAAQEGGEGAFNSVTKAELVTLVSQLLAANASVNVGLEKYKEMHRQANNAALEATEALEELREKG